MDDRRKHFIGMDRARFQLETSMIGNLSKTFEAEIGGKVYQLGVFEDCFLSGCETEGFLLDDPSEEQQENVSSSGDSHELTSKRGSTEQDQGDSPAKDDYTQISGKKGEGERSHSNSKVSNSDNKGSTQRKDERVAEIQSENALGEGNGSTRVLKLNSRDIEITKKMVPGGGQVKGCCDTNMEGLKRSKENSRYEVEELEESLSEDESFLSMEKIQKRLKVLRRKTTKEKEVVKYKRRMKSGSRGTVTERRRGEKTQQIESLSQPEA